MCDATFFGEILPLSARVEEIDDDFMTEVDPSYDLHVQFKQSPQRVSAVIVACGSHAHELVASIIEHAKSDWIEHSRLILRPTCSMSDRRYVTSVFLNSENSIAIVKMLHAPPEDFAYDLWNEVSSCFSNTPMFTVTLSSQSAHLYRHRPGSNRNDNVAVRCLSSRKARAGFPSVFSGNAKLPIVESPNVIGNVPAAALTWCEQRNLSGCSIVSYFTSTDRLDSIATTVALGRALDLLRNASDTGLNALPCLNEIIGRLQKAATFGEQQRYAIDWYERQMMSKSDGDPSASETSMMGNYQNFYDQAINQCESKIRQLTDAKSEYTCVLKSLSELGASTSTSLSVPISNIAHFSAVPESSRKDQVLLLLGDKWFVETDSKHACQIASRRLEHVNSSLSALERDLATLKQQNAELRALKNTESTGDQHQSEKSDESTKNYTDQPSAPKNVSEAEFARLMQRLDELERMEEDEQLDSDDSLEPAESVSDQNQELHNTKQPVADNELKRKLSDGSNKRVRFDSDQNDTLCYDKTQTTLEQSGTENGEPDKPTSSASNDPAPILRNKDEKSPVNIDAPLLANDEPPKPRPIIEMSSSMFTGEVVERNVTETNYAITGVGDRPAPPKRVSLFQQRRL